MNWLRNFLVGRYGNDTLNTVLFIFSIILTLISSIAHLQILYFISYIPLALCIFRLLSRNVNARLKENNKFLQLYNPAQAWVKNEYRIIRGTSTHKYFKCPSCKQIVRVPKGKGAITITCPKCSNKFTKNT